MKRKEVYTVLDGERDYQERGKENEKSHITEDFNLGDAGFAMQKLLNELNETWYSEKAPYPKSMHLVRKIGGICVAMGEKYDMPDRIDMTQEAKEFVRDVKEKAEGAKKEVDEAVGKASKKVKEWADKAAFEYRVMSQRAGKKATDIDKQVDEFMEQVDKTGISRETFNWLKKKYFGQ